MIVARVEFTDAGKTLYDSMFGLPLAPAGTCLSREIRPVACDSVTRFYGTHGHSRRGNLQDVLECGQRPKTSRLQKPAGLHIFSTVIIMETAFCYIIIIVIASAIHPALVCHHTGRLHLGQGERTKRWCPWYRTPPVLLEKIEDVTEKILAAAEGIDDPVEREKKIDGTITQMTEEIEGGRDDILANVASMYNGKQYILFVYKRYQDVRIVYAPPNSIGTYGGDIDNWMWPRHTGDFTYLRVYMAPDGSGAKYSPDNIPVKPKTISG